MRLYKLTDEHDQTYNKTQWGPNVTHTAPGTGELCTDGWIHAYTDPLLAVLINAIHANFEHPHMWESEGLVGKNDSELKVGCTSLTTLQQIPVPIVTTEQRVRFAIRCALAVYDNPQFLAWAKNWINGEDRTANSAEASAWDAEAATLAAKSAAKAAAWAAAWAAWAAKSAAWAAAAARASAASAEASAEAAWAAAESAAWAAAWAAAAARAAGSLPLAEFARWAVSDEPLPV